jgi:hypothetical protein
MRSGLSALNATRATSVTLVQVRTLRTALVVAATGCRIDFADLSDGGIARPDTAPGFFDVGGTVTGATGALVVKDNGVDTLIVNADGPFTFATPVMAGQSYVVTVAQPPSGQTCVVANGGGVVASTVTDVAVSCFLIGACPATAVTYNDDGSFTVPSGCTSFTVEALGGGGGGSAKNGGTKGAGGGSGGHAIKTFSGIAEGTVLEINIGRGGACGSTAASSGGYTGGAGGMIGKVGGDGAGLGIGGAGGAGSLHGGTGGVGGYAGAGGGGGGDDCLGVSGGGATTFRSSTGMDLVVAGGGGGAGVADEDLDVAGAGGAACGSAGGGDAGAAASAGQNSSGGGGGGDCYCIGGCDSTVMPTGGMGGVAGVNVACEASQSGAPGKLVLTFP